MKRIKLTLLILLSGLFALAQYPRPVAAALSKTNTNKAELMQALDYFYRKKDSLKIKAINFLVAAMPLHTTHTYYWADRQGRRIAYNELDYPSFNAAVTALTRIEQRRGKLHPVAYTYRDIDSIKASLLIDDVNLATAAYRLRKIDDAISESDFLEYILPYRVSIEPLQSWRSEYAARFRNTFPAGQPAQTQLTGIRQLMSDTFQNIYSIDGKTEPLPRMGAMQILLRKKGYCEDMADMTVFIARSRGIPCTVDNIPFWATSTGNHFMNFVRINGQIDHFDAGKDSLTTEPGKVLRTTFSARPDAIAMWLDTAYIPGGFMRIRNYFDVTAEYWPVSDITCTLEAAPGPDEKMAYACVYNGAVWRPIWYGRISGTSATFTNMGKGAVYLPMYYTHGKMRPAGWPYALGYRNKLVLKPDPGHSRNIILKEQDKYLKYRSGRKYRLYYWNKEWKSVGEQTASPGCQQLAFAHVPANALLLLVPDYSRRKERPFIVTDAGERIWW